MKRKFFALIMAAVMCLGMSMTVFAADETVDPNGSPEPTFAQIVYDNVTIAAGGGYLEKITDMDMQKSMIVWQNIPIHLVIHRSLTDRCIPIRPGCFIRIFILLLMCRV